MKPATRSTWKTVVPIYDAEVTLVIADNIQRERIKMEEVFGPSPEEDDYAGLTSHHGHLFALFFSRKELSTKLIAHEVFHLTHRIMDWAGANFDPKHHEQGALLCGYLTHWVYQSMGAQTRKSL